MFRIYLISALLFVACSGDVSPKGDTTEGARIAAQIYYEALVNGQYEKFLYGREDAKAMPDDYRRQMVESFRQFVEQQRLAHDGITSVEATEAIADTSLQVVQVMLTVNFADDLHEEIVVPMVFDGEQWLMR